MYGPQATAEQDFCGFRMSNIAQPFMDSDLESGFLFIGHHSCLNNICIHVPDSRKSTASTMATNTRSNYVVCAQDPHSQSTCHNKPKSAHLGSAGRRIITGAFCLRAAHAAVPRQQPADYEPNLPRSPRKSRPAPSTSPYSPPRPPPPGSCGAGAGHRSRAVSSGQPLALLVRFPGDTGRADSAPPVGGTPFPAPFSALTDTASPLTAPRPKAPGEPAEPMAGGPPAGEPEPGDSEESVEACLARLAADPAAAACPRSRRLDRRYREGSPWPLAATANWTGLRAAIGRRRAALRPPRGGWGPAGTDAEESE